MATPFSQSIRQQFDLMSILQQLRDSPEIFALLDDLPGTELQRQTALRRQFSGEVVRAAAELHAVRKRATSKFASAERMWMDRRGYEQATHELVAAHKASRFRGLVWDLCSGIGIDSIALAARGPVVGVDVDPANALRARWNAEERAQSPIFLCADVVHLPLDEADFRRSQVHIDPDRRAGRSARVVRIEEYTPGIEYLEVLTQSHLGGAVKLSPAANFGGKFPGTEIELVSLNGECKEATVWFGELASIEGLRATVLPSQDTLTGDPLSVDVEVGELEDFLFDPDPAVVRAGLVDVLAEELSLSRLDPEEEYLTGASVLDSPFVRGFEVVANLPNNERAIRNYFRTSQVGELEIKCRRIPTDIDKLRRTLLLPGTEPAVLLFVRVNGKARAVVARRLAPKSTIST